MELAIPLSKNGEPLFRQVYLGLRQAILVGNFPVGDRLPSTRDLAEQLGISRTVVLLAYDQLLAEGFVVGRGGSGTYVSEELGGSVPEREKRSANIRLSRLGPPPPMLRQQSILQGDNRPRFATILHMAEATSRPFPSRCGDACCCGMREWLRFANLTTALPVGASSCAKPSALICEDLARWSAIRQK